MPYSLQAESGDFESGSPISGADVTKVIKKLWPPPELLDSRSVPQGSGCRGAVLVNATFLYRHQGSSLGLAEWGGGPLV